MAKIKQLPDVTVEKLALDAAKMKLITHLVQKKLVPTHRDAHLLLNKAEQANCLKLDDGGYKVSRIVNLCDQKLTTEAIYNPTKASCEINIRIGPLSAY